MSRPRLAPSLTAALALVLVLQPLGEALSAPPLLEPWHEARDLRLEAGMGTLLSWGALNTVAGLAGRLSTDDRRLQGF